MSLNPTTTQAPTQTSTQAPTQTSTPVGTPDAAKVVWLKKVLPQLDAKTIEIITARQGNREAMSKKILDWTEGSANATKKPGDSLAHAVSAHGPGTDQTPRLVTGRRADEVVAENKAGTTPTTKVKLKEIPGGTDVEMPAWDKVGNDPSNVSSRFGSATQMLLTVEEAFAQAALLQSRIAAENKETDKRAMKVKEVQVAADALGKARKTEGETRLAAKLASEALQTAIKDAEATTKGSEARTKAEAKVEAARKDLETKAAKYVEASKGVETAIDTLRKEKQKAAPGSRSQIGEDRQKLVVEPGGVIGESFKVGDDEKALEKGAALAPEDMKRRYDSITNTKGIKTASVIMDPAFVKDEFGQKHQAGFQIQTAFPSTGEDPQRNVTEDDFKKIRAKEDGTAALDPARKDIEAAEKEKNKVIEVRTKNKQAVEALRAERKSLETEISKIDPEYMSESDKKELYGPEAGKKFKTEQDLVKAFEDAKKKLGEVKADIKKGDQLEATLAEDEKRTTKAVADKTAELAKQTKALEQKLAEKGAELDTASFKAAEAAEKDAVASIAGIREQKAKAEKALAEAPSGLAKEKLDQLKRQVSEMKSLEQSAIRQVKEARETLLKSLEAAAAAAAEAKAARTEAKDKAEQDVANATKGVAAPGEKPKQESFTDGNEKKREADFKKALKTWETADARHKKAEETKAAKTVLFEAAKAKLQEADEALTAAQAKVTSLKELMKAKL